MRGSSSGTVDRLGLGEPRSRSRSFDHFAPTSGYSNTRGSPTHQTRQGSSSASKRPRSPRRRAEELEVSSSAEEQQVSSDGSTIFALRAPDVVCCGDKSRGRRLRIVCLSDTHGKHHDIRHKIPDGDILVHCGDFATKLSQRDFESATEDFDRFLGSLPHRHKVLIAGNHEIAFNSYSREQIQRRIRNAIYLEDTGTVIEGLTFFGTPWTNSSHMGFSCRGTELESKWAKIPAGVDILLSHMPPYNVLDLAFDPGSTARDNPCPVCRETHRSYAHWGSWTLTDRVKLLKPKVHVFGHVHNSHGIMRKDDTLYINAAQDMNPQPIFFDIWV